MESLALSLKFFIIERSSFLSRNSEVYVFLKFLSNSAWSLMAHVTGGFFCTCQSELAPKNNAFGNYKFLFTYA